LQLLIDDFDPDSPADMAEITSQYWVVYCNLVDALSADIDMSTKALYSENGRKELARLLLGTWVASPFHTSDDPDPPRAARHPTTRAASPTSRFITVSAANPEARPLHEYPGMFFIFPDISVRKAGEYRLLFTLMKITEDRLQTGATVPFIDVAVSDIFRAVNAKDFDQVHASTPLVRGLIDRGAGFPLKLKKGTRETSARKRQHSDEEEDSGAESPAASND
jgi:hypothetical protein